jgi:hypothetical protein
MRRKSPVRGVLDEGFIVEVLDEEGCLGDASFPDSFWICLIPETMRISPKTNMK